MESFYLDRYNIVHTYKESKFQKVLVGKDIKNNQPVVINNFYIDDNSYTWNLTEENYKDIFENIVHFEKTDNGMTIITKVEEGSSLDEYLTDFEPTFTERIDLIYQYLNSIKKYDHLPNNVKSILVDESQIIMTDEKICFGELIIFNDSNFAIESFDEVKSNIISVLQRLTSLPHIDYGELPLYINIVGFIDELRKNDEDYNNIEKIFSDFEKLNMASLLSINEEQNLVSPSNNNLVEKTVDSINESSSIEMSTINSNKNIPLAIAIGTAGIITAILVGLFVFKPILPSNNSTNGSNGVIDVNANELEDENSEDTITDNNEITRPNDNINYVSEHIEKDFTTSKFGSFSFKISSNSNKDIDEPHKITIDQGFAEANSKFSMWIKSNTDDKINITVKGYSKGNLSFRESIVYAPLNINSWELVQFTLTNSIDGHVDIIFNNISGTAWVDKISIDIFK